MITVIDLFWQVVEDAVKHSPPSHPHPANLAWHRENIFGQMASEDLAPWE
ncbi:hypothetical protein SAMN06295998_1055 [Primorskyibacter flagellatus]|uniref:Uncharacterized protein n=1 Tax=Primorskyibacter flagellatus TaxID=1387277 RepID=A0A1W2BUK5_9RHOB|nr:hypothetical protein SAMN06295998_1055 [Primorskyibacter flagellatus]